MSIIHKTISINTNNDIELIDITEDIQSILRSHEIHNGIINISTKHTTSAIVINENENGLKKDYINFLREIVPKKEYYHDLIDYPEQLLNKYLEELNPLVGKQDITHYLKEIEEIPGGIQFISLNHLRK